MSERPNLAVQFISPVESSASEFVHKVVDAQQEPVLNNEAEISNEPVNHDDIGDLIKIGKNGKTFHRGAGASGGGKFLSKHQLEVITAHADQIRDGLEENKLAQSMSQADVADSDIEFALAQRRLNARADELEQAAVSSLNNKFPSETIEAEVQQDDVQVEESRDENENSVEARDGETIGEYEERHDVPEDQRTNSEILDDIYREEGLSLDTPIAPSAEAILDEIDQQEADFQRDNSASTASSAETIADEETQPPSLRERIRDALTPQGLYAEITTLSRIAGEKLGKHKKAKIALGVLAVAGGLTVYFATKDSNSGGTGGSFWKDLIPETPKGSSGGDGAGGASQLDPSQFNINSRTVNGGEGWYQTFADMNIPSSERADLLQKVGPELQKLGVAYPDGDSFGISQSGRLSDDVLQLIQDSRK